VDYLLAALAVTRTADFSLVFSGQMYLRFVKDSLEHVVCLMV
jgi:hypothetical protein